MGLDPFTNQSGHEYEHDVLTEILNETIPEVSRDLVFGEHEECKNVNPRDVTDEAVLEAVEWDGPSKRREKWLLMAGEMVFQVEQSREKQSLQTDSSEDTGLGGLASFSSGPMNINWQDCYNEAADAVAIYVDGASCAESIKDGLRGQTFGREISIQVPREVLRRLVVRVQNREDVTVDEVIAQHREAIESL
jgi:hypothetical protein